MGCVLGALTDETGLGGEVAVQKRRQCGPFLVVQVTKKTLLGKMLAKCLGCGEFDSGVVYSIIGVGHEVEGEKFVRSGRDDKIGVHINGDDVLVLDCLGICLQAHAIFGDTEKDREVAHKKVDVFRREWELAAREFLPKP